MKWFLIALVGVVCSATWARGDAAGDLYNQGANALAAGQYDAAAQAFDSLVKGYPTSANVDDARIRAGFAYMHEGKFDDAVDRLSKEAAATAKPQYRGTALYFTGLTQFSKAQKAATKADATTAFTQAAATLTTLIDLINTAPTPDNKDYLEDAMYYRALAQFQAEDYDSAEKDLLLLVQQFGTSLKAPDYYLLLGSLYAVETNQAVAATKPNDTVRAIAAKSLDAFDHVSRDPNALVQANTANMSKAEVLYLIAQFEVGNAGYEKALDAFRLVRRKDDMVPLQQERLEKLKKDSQAALQSAASGASLANDTSRLIEREEGRLDELKTGPDPIIQALIRIAECYVAMKDSDSARTVLHRLAKAKLTPDQQQEVDFQLLYSYVLGGQTDKADAALTDYLSKHASDPNADSISYQIGAKLLDRGDYAGALAQALRSRKDFPNGKYLAQVIALQAQALTKLGRIQESDDVVNNFLKENPTSPVANSMFLTKAQSETARQDFNGALADYGKVKDNASASVDVRAGADAGYIQALNSLQRYDDVIKEASAFETQYPTSSVLPSVMVLSGIAMDQKHDPGAVAALQDVARKFPKDPAAPFALNFVINIYQRANNIPAMIQAATDLRTAFPTAYDFIAQAADAVSAVCVKEKKFDDAIGLYQPLTTAPKPEVAAAANNKIGGIWLAAAHAMGAYQSMTQDPVRAEAVKRLTAAEQSYLGTLKNFPDEMAAVGDAFDGLDGVLKQRRSWGLLTDADMEAYLGKLTADLSSADMQTRVELAKAGLVFVYKGGDKQFPAALDRFRKAVGANPSLHLTRQEANQYGQLLIAGKDYATAEQVYTDLLANTPQSDVVALADGYYGLGATAEAQGDMAKAAESFAKMKALPGGALWHPHIQDANFALALAAEQSGDPNGLAMQTYAAMMQAPQAGYVLQAKAMLGYGRLLEKAGRTVAPATPGSMEFAVHYYQEVNTLFGPATPTLSAEGLFDAGQAYEKAGDKASARKQYEDLKAAYQASAPDWAAKAKAAEDNLGA